MHITNPATSTAMQAAISSSSAQAGGAQKSSFDPQTLLQNALQRSVSAEKGLLASTAMTARATAVVETSKSDRMRALATRLSPRESLIRQRAMRSYKDMADGRFLDEDDMR
jgi:hypothetical protein